MPNSKQKGDLKLTDIVVFSFILEYAQFPTAANWLSLGMESISSLHLNSSLASFIYKGLIKLYANGNILNIEGSKYWRKRCMVPGSGHADFLGYFELIHWWLFLLVDWLIFTQAGSPSSSMRSALHFVSFWDTRRLGTALAGACEVAAAPRKGCHLEVVTHGGNHDKQPGTRSQRKKRCLLTHPDMGETRQSVELTSTRNSVFLLEVWGSAVLKVNIRLLHPSFQWNQLTATSSSQATLRQLLTHAAASGMSFPPKAFLFTFQS